MKLFCWAISIFLATVSSACSQCHDSEPVRSFDGEDLVFADNRAIAHALGGIDGVAYSNSVEAFRRSVDLGFRLVEVDLTFAGDELICFHQGSEGELRWRSPKDVASWPVEHGLARYAGRYRVITARELLQTLLESPGIYLVTDTKGDNAEVLRRLIEAAEEVDTDLVGRIIPQIYHPDEAAVVREIAPFHRLILTLYMWDSSDAEVAAAVAEHGFEVVVMPISRFSPDFAAELRALGALPYVHTVNDAAEIQRLIEQGAHGVYTDFDTSLLQRQ